MNKYMMLSKENIIGSQNFENGKLYDYYKEGENIYLLESEKDEIGIYIEPKELKFLKKVKSEENK